jgi:uncharacterized protein YegJ (DUF2314 family)
MRRSNRPGIAGALLASMFIQGMAWAASPAPAPNGLIAPADAIVITHALHFAPAPKGDVKKQAEELLESKFPTLKRMSSRNEVVQGPAIFLEVLDMKAEGFEAPTMEQLQYFGRGVTREQGEAMQKSTVAAAFTFTYRAPEAFATLRLADEFMNEIAMRTQGLILDIETRELYTPDHWAAQRLAPPDHGFPDVRAHITIHAYQDEEYVRAISLGMNKFGLPDLVIDEFSWSLSRQMGNLINLFAQLLIEGALPRLGDYDLDVSAVKHTSVREMYEESVLEGAKPVAKLDLVEAVAEDGDPDNRLIELRFDRYEGGSVHEKHQKFAATFYGSVDAVAYIKHNDAVRAASERARKQLPALRKTFKAGLEPGERILLKAPFERPDGGTEWMWVEVSSWKSNRIRGLLSNEPEEIPDLHAGATVDVEEDDVFDYIHYKADGTAEGNETGREIQKLQGGR